MHLASFIGLRFLRAPRRTRSITAVTWFSVLGVMLGVTTLIIVLSVMNGFRDNMFLAITGTMPNARAMPPEGDLSAMEADALKKRLNSLPGLLAVSPYLSRQAFLRAGGKLRAIILRGIDPVAEARVTELTRFIKLPPGDAPRPPNPADSGKENALAGLRYPPPSGERAGILLGRPLADELALHPGDEVDLISTKQRITPIGPVPLVKRFRVAGVFYTGLSHIDEVIAYVGMPIAQKLYRMKDHIGGLAFRLADPQQLDPMALRNALQGYRVVTWKDENRNIFQVMELEKLGVFLVLTLIIIVAFFNIIGSLTMLVLEKRKAIAILKSMGASNALIRKVFFMQGVWIGLVGTLAGLMLGLSGSWALDTFEIIRLPKGVFPTADRLPISYEWADYALITGTSFLICLLVTLYPATAAARTRPVENLRNE
ncbi:MAG: ABC transporter permease [bacterium]